MNIIQSSTPKLVKQENAAPVAPLMNLYDETPTFELTLDEFEVFALQRLKVLRKIEQLKLLRVPPDQTRAKLDQLLREELRDPNVDEASHFILRLSYCQSEELRRWFLQHESLLFAHRLQHLSDEQLASSMRSYAQLSPISRERKEELREPLLQLMTPTDYATSQFYAAPFTQALDLVASRQCYLLDGWAYIPQAKVVSILVAKFRTKLSRQLAMMGKGGAYAHVDNPEAVRIYPLLKNMNNLLVHHETASDTHLAGSAQLTAANVEQYVPKMPLCMRQLQAGMKADKKLRHWGRLQYGLFLKGAGLSMDDALLFFQRHFTAVTGEQFQKQYSYNIRHMYGKEGKRATYTPYSCSKIILGNAPNSTGDHHGCPYKHYDTDNLSRLLQTLSVGTAADRNAILALQKSGQFQLACVKHFEALHPNSSTMPDVNMDDLGNHPNAWLRASVSYHEHSKESSLVSPEK